jgi:hypothetical protein
VWGIKWSEEKRRREEGKIICTSTLLEFACAQREGSFTSSLVVKAERGRRRREWVYSSSSDLRNRPYHSCLHSPFAMSYVYL